jgi:hypothetical protein
MRYLSFDIEKAKDDPKAIFRHPREVLCVVNLRDEERLDILELWREHLLTLPNDASASARQEELLALQRAIADVLGEGPQLQEQRAGPEQARKDRVIRSNSRPS